ncbi:MAG: hypothetical protein ABI832_02700 [bacterium]
MLRLTALTFAAVLLATAADAGPKGNKGNSGHGNKHFTGGAYFCPPGLAKKNPPCIPPGQSRNYAPVVVEPEAVLPTFQTGELLPDDYIVLADPRIYRPDLDAIYVRYDGILYLIDRLTAEVLDRIGPVADWTWDWSEADPTGCPPGLAKKDPPCVPPGLVGTGMAIDPSDAPIDYEVYGIGDVLPDGYVVAIDPKLYSANDSAAFVRQGDMIYRADPSTGTVIDPVSPIGKLIE